MKGRRRFWIWIVVGIAAIAAPLAYLRLRSGNMVQHSPNTDGRFVAEVRTFDPASAMDTRLVVVFLRRTGVPLRHGVFDGLDYGSSVAVSWTTATDLVVRCKDCKNMAVYLCEQRWGDVTIHYVFDDGSPTYPPTTFSSGVQGECGNGTGTARGQ